jgi:tetratricopeptide (TPR) repeat protein
MIPAVRRAVPLLLLVGLPELAAQGPTPSPAQAEANRLYQARDWPAAAKAYDALVKEAPGNPTWRYRLGVSLLGLGKPGDALVALAPASQAQGPLGGLVFFGMARAQARLGEKDRAFEALKKAGAAGFAQVSLLESEPDLLALRADARFKEVIAGADRNARPCVYRPESRAFDFWVGDWDVTTSAGPAGTSHVERILGDCVIFESWTGANGFSGRSFNFFDAARKRWQQTWVDNVGVLLEFHGEAREGNLYFAGEGVPAGQTQPVKNRMTFFRVGPDEVRQLIEQSSDGGQTWNVSFDGAYKRAGKTPPDSAPTAP